NCAAGTISTRSGATECTICDCGYEPTDPTLPTQFSCRLCLPGSFSPNGTQCLQCPINEFSTNSGACECNTCGPGTEVALNGANPRTACRLCSPGFFSSDDGTCQPCPSGEIATSSGATQCIRCPCGSMPN